MFDEVFGGVNLGTQIDETKCPCGCGCMCWEGAEQRVSHMNTQCSTVHAGSYATTPD